MKFLSSYGFIVYALKKSVQFIVADSLDRLGFSQGNILEPSCGTGNFFGLLPDSMQNSKLHGVEIDSLTGRIAKQLYQKANIAIEGFEKTNLPDDHFDVVLGNVPFGEIRVNDSRYNAQKLCLLGR